MLRQLWVLWGVSWFGLWGFAHAQQGPGLPEPTVLVQPSAAPLALPQAVTEALSQWDWQAAVQGLQPLTGTNMTQEQRGYWAFLLCYSLVHSGQAEQAAPWLAHLDHAPALPPAYVALVRGEVARATNDLLGALSALEQVPASSVPGPRALIQQAEVLRELGRTKESYAVYQALIQRPDPAPGNPEALLVLAQRVGLGSNKANGYLRRVWWAYPRSAYSRRAMPGLAQAPEPTWQQVGRRAENLMRQSAWKTILAETEPHAAQATGNTLDACRLAYARGRAFYKLGRLSRAIETLSGIGARCQNQAPNYGAKGQYLTAKSLFRKGDYAQSARAYQVLPKLYPALSLADDGYTQAGIALYESGDALGARALWERALQAFPMGDTVPEATFRRAWSHYLDGQTPKAIAVADVLAALPVSLDPTHVEAGQYWAARWRLYPNVSDPTALTPDSNAKNQGIWQLMTLCQRRPHSVYAVLAYSRLRELDPARAALLASHPLVPRSQAQAQPWRVRKRWFESKAVQQGMLLAQLGLVREAVAELKREPPVWPSEVALLAEWRTQAGDWLRAHDTMRRWLRRHPPGTLGDQQAGVLRVGYPDHYLPEVKQATQEQSYDFRLFHALVREESNFNRVIRSAAGARGLAQLMPATARQTAGWLGTSVTTAQLTDPTTNLTLGAKYLDVVMRQLGGNPYLALAGYNAGPHRVQQWREKRGNLPSDEFIERIPFAETRGYVKRVTSTWQTYHYQFDSGPAFVDLSAFNNQIMP